MTLSLPQILLAAARAIVSEEQNAEGDDARDALLGELRVLLPSPTCSRAELALLLVTNAVFESTAEQLPNATQLVDTARAVVAFDVANPKRDERFAMFERADEELDEDPNEDANEDARRAYEADLFSAADRERMDPRTYE